MIKYLIAAVFSIAILAILSTSNLVFAGETNTGEPKIGVAGFLDEDGDGFNDLMPDTDGDGVPDALDPDFKNRQSDSVFMRQQMSGANDTSGVHRRDPLGDDPRHPILHDGMGPLGPGEPGQYGPGDSTGHGGMHDGHWRDGHHGGRMRGDDGDSSGMGGDGGHRPIIEPRDGGDDRKSGGSNLKDNISSSTKEAPADINFKIQIKDGSK